MKFLQNYLKRNFVLLYKIDIFVQKIDIYV